MPQKDWKRAYEETKKLYELSYAENRAYKEQFEWNNAQKVYALDQLHQADSVRLNLELELDALRERAETAKNQLVEAKRKLVEAQEELATLKPYKKWAVTEHLSDNEKIQRLEWQLKELKKDMNAPSPQSSLSRFGAWIKHLF